MRRTDALELAAPHGLIKPAVDPDSAPWWEGLEHGQVRAQRCMQCGHLYAPASPTCPACGSRGAVWERLSGRGRIYSWTTVHHAMDPAFDADVPYSVVAVDLEEGPRVLGRLLEGAGAAGLLVQAQIYEVQGQALLGFRPTRREDG